MVLIATLRPPRTASHAGRRIEVRPQAWESDFFGARMGALVMVGPPTAGDLTAQAEALAAELRLALREAELDGYQHLVLRLGADDLGAVWAAERAGLRLMDVGVDLTFRFGATPLPQPRALAARQATPADIPALQAMTTGAFSLTRFATDPFFGPEQVDRFYQTWAANLFAGLADCVLVADIDGQVAGFVSCKLGEPGSASGRIPLVATASAFQRRGVARDLLAAAVQWFGAAGCQTASVKTQAANYAAVALYERAGFTVSHTELTFTTTLN